EDFSTLFTVSALTDWLPMPIVTKPKQTEQRPIVYLRKLNLCSISLLKTDFRLCILHFLFFIKNINLNYKMHNKVFFLIFFFHFRTNKMVAKIHCIFVAFERRENQNLKLRSKKYL